MSIIGFFPPRGSDRKNEDPNHGTQSKYPTTSLSHFLRGEREEILIKRTIPVATACWIIIRGTYGVVILTRVYLRNKGGNR